MLSIKASISALKFTPLLKQSLSIAAKIASRSSPHTKSSPIPAIFFLIYALIGRPPQFPKLAIATARVSRLIFFLVTMIIMSLSCILRRLFFLISSLIDSFWFVNSLFKSACSYSKSVFGNCTLFACGGLVGVCWLPVIFIIVVSSDSIQLIKFSC